MKELNERGCLIMCCAVIERAIGPIRRLTPYEVTREYNNRKMFLTVGAIVPMVADLMDREPKKFLKALMKKLDEQLNDGLYLAGARSIQRKKILDELTGMELENRTDAEVDSELFQEIENPNNI